MTHIFQPPPAIPPTATQTTPRPSRSRRDDSRGQSHVITRYAIVRGVWVFGGAWSKTPLLSLRILASHQPQPSWELLALLALLAKHDDATRSSRHVCHAPTVSAAKKGRLGSGASAAVVLHAEGPEACPVALCIHAERHGMRSFLSLQEPCQRQRASIHKALPSRRFVCSSTTTTVLPLVPLHKTTCSPSTTVPFPASVSAAPFSKYPSLGENDPSAVRPTYPNAPLLAADWYLTAVAPDWHDTTRGSCRFWAQDLRLCNLLIPLGTRLAKHHTTHELP